jgi:hypothetical protein
VGGSACWRAAVGNQAMLRRMAFSRPAMRCGSPPPLSHAAPALRRKCAALELGLQRKVAPEADHHTSREVPPIVREVLRSPGQPLEAAVRAFFEPRFGHDFSEVRLHIDGAAAESARKLNARAYTVGAHLAFDRDQYNPETFEGQRLLAHELTHVVQQDGRSSSDKALGSGMPRPSVRRNPVQLARQACQDTPAQPVNLSPDEVQKLASAQGWRQWALSRALNELKDLARALSMTSDPTQLSGAFGATIAAINIWLDVGLGDQAPANSLFAASGQDYFSVIVDVARQRIRNNISTDGIPVSKVDDSWFVCCLPCNANNIGQGCTSQISAWTDVISNQVYVCAHAFFNSAWTLGGTLTHEYFHLGGLVHGPELPLSKQGDELPMDSCTYSTTTDERLDNPYCMTAMILQIATASSL